jgi:hypothetical protein
MVKHLTVIIWGGWGGGGRKKNNAIEWPSCKACESELSHMWQWKIWNMCHLTSPRKLFTIPCQLTLKININCLLQY